MKKRGINILVAAMVVVASVVGLFSGEVRAGEDCRDVQFVFARGSGAKYGTNKEWLSWKSEVAWQAGKLGISYEAREVDYDAVAINFTTAIEAFVSGGKAFRFRRSVNGGVDNLVGAYKEIAKKCKNTRFVFAGFSQGAMVVMDTLLRVDSEKIMYVALFGDPELNLPEGKGIRPPACRGKSLSEYRVHVPDCRTDNGVLGARTPYVPDGFAGKIGLWCNDDDIICGSSANLFKNGGHSKYASEGHVGWAVSEAVKRIRTEFELGDGGSGEQANSMMSARTEYATFGADAVLSSDDELSPKNVIARWNSESEVLLQWELPDGLEHVLVSVNGFPLGYTQRGVTEIRITEVETSGEVSFTVTGLNEGFDIAGSREIVLVGRVEPADVSGDDVVTNNGAAINDDIGAGDFTGDEAIEKDVEMLDGGNLHVEGMENILSAGLGEGSLFEVPETGDTNEDVFVPPMWILMVLVAIVGLVMIYGVGKKTYPNE